MVQTTARVLTMLEVLQSGGTWTVADLAGRLDVDKRTVRRYADNLRELGIPVHAQRGRYGGYRLARHFRMPPLMLTDEEALAVIWSLLATGRSGSGPVSPTAVAEAVAKVRRVLPTSLAARIDSVVGIVEFVDERTGTPRANDHETDAAPPALMLIAEAARAGRPIAFDYTARPGRSTPREIHPHGVVAHRGVLYLAGHDVDRQAARTFRLDRVRKLRTLEGRFEPTLSRTTLVEQVMGPLPSAPGRHDVSVLIEAGAQHVREFFPELLASVDPVADRGGWVRVVVRAERLGWVAARLAAVDRPFVVEHPTELRDAVEALAHRLLTGVSTSGDPVEPDDATPDG